MRERANFPLFKFVNYRGWRSIFSRFLIHVAHAVLTGYACRLCMAVVAICARAMHVVGGDGFALVYARAGRNDGADLGGYVRSCGLRAAAAECRRRQECQEQCASLFGFACGPVFSAAR